MRERTLPEQPAGQRGSRLLLCDLTARVLKQGLEVLGIEVLEQILRVLIRAIAQEHSALRVFASGHDFWTCVFVPRDIVEQFDSCIARSSIVGYEKPHEPYGACLFAALDREQPV